MTVKSLFSRSLAAAPDRLHFAAHSHHLWPDASFDGQVECWSDAARLADRKWDRVMGDIWPEAQAEVAAELGSGDPSAIVFADNTHSLLVRLAAACPRRAGEPLRILTSDGEFHSARRQLARWVEAGDAVVTEIAAEPFGDFSDRFLSAARLGRFDLILVSQVMFGSGAVVHEIAELAALADPAGPWLAIDGYHAFMAIDRPFPATATRSAFYLGGGYKYAMSGEGMAFLHCPPGYGPRPPITGWYAEFDDLTLPPGSIGYAPDAMRFMGATFDPSALYRFLHVRRALAAAGLTTAAISAHARAFQERLIDGIASTPLAGAELLNPLDDGPHARFLAFRSPAAQAWCDALAIAGVVTDVRGDVLRIGFGLYQDDADVDALLGVLESL